MLLGISIVGILKYRIIGIYPKYKVCIVLQKQHKVPFHLHPENLQIKAEHQEQPQKCCPFGV